MQQLNPLKFFYQIGNLEVIKNAIYTSWISVDSIFQWFCQKNYSLPQEITDYLLGTLLEYLNNALHLC